VALARCLLYDILSDVHANYSVKIGSWVDDLSQIVLASKAPIVGIATKSLCYAAERLKALATAISSKSTIVGNDISMVREVLIELAGSGFFMKTAPTCKDHGVDASSGARRRLSTLKSRIIRAPVRAKRIKSLQLVSKSTSQEAFSVRVQTHGRLGPPGQRNRANISKESKGRLHSHCCCAEE
jgi:hypothetical protein